MRILGGKNPTLSALKSTFIFQKGQRHSLGARSAVQTQENKPVTLSNLAVKCTEFLIETVKYSIGLLAFPWKNYMWHLVYFMCFTSSVTTDKSGKFAPVFHRNGCKSMALLTPDLLYSGKEKPLKTAVRSAQFLHLSPSLFMSPAIAFPKRFSPSQLPLKCFCKPHNLIFLVGNNLLRQIYRTLP